MNKDNEMEKYWKEQERFNQEYWKLGENKDDSYWDGAHVHQDMEYWNDETKGLKHDHVLASSELACEAPHEEKYELEIKTKEQKYEEYKKEKEARLAAQAQNAELEPLVYQEKKIEKPQEEPAMERVIHSASEVKQKPKGVFYNPIVLLLGSIIFLIKSAVDFEDYNRNGLIVSMIAAFVILIQTVKTRKYSKSLLCIFSIMICFLTLLMCILLLPEVYYW